MVTSISTLLWKLLKCISGQSVVHLWDDQEKKPQSLPPSPKLKAQHGEPAAATDSALCSAVAHHSHWVQGKSLLSTFQQTCIKPLSHRTVRSFISPLREDHLLCGVNDLLAFLLFNFPRGVMHDESGAVLYYIIIVFLKLI